MKTVAIPDASLNARTIRRVHLIEIQAGVGSSTFFRFTDNNAGDITTTIDGVSRTFTRLFFVLGQVAASIAADENTEVTFLDIDDTIRSIVLNYDIRQWPVTIWEYWPVDDKAEPLIIGVADGIELPEEESKRAVLGVIASVFDYDAPGLLEYDAKTFPYAPVPGAKFTWGPYTETVNSRPVWKAKE